MDQAQTNKTVERGRWWIGLLIGDFEASFINEPAYIDVPLDHRREAARLALNESFRRLKFWGALVFLIAAVVGFSLLDTVLHLSDGNGTAGAGLGFVMGLIAIQRAIYNCGLPVYQDTLSKLKNAEQADAGNRRSAGA